MGSKATVAIGVVAFLIGVKLLLDRRPRTATDRRPSPSPLDDQFVRILLENRAEDVPRSRSA